jgi:arylsulfatase A-like enzyme
MKLQRRQFLQAVTGGVAASLMANAEMANAEAADLNPQPAAAGPNILVIMADQHRAGLTRRSGFPLDTMPNLDRLAETGVAFERAYTTAPLCVPARVSMLTGRWPHAHRVRQNSAPHAAVFEKDLFQVAKAKGYRTGLAGKNHSYLDASRLDFWHEYSHLSGWKPAGGSKELDEYDAWMEHLNHGVSLTANPFPAELQYPYRIVSDAIEYIDSAGSQPFALWVSFPEPHNPYQVSKPYFDLFPPQDVPERSVGPEVLKAKGFKWEWLGQLENRFYPGYNDYWRRTRSNYLGMLRLIDDQIGRLLGHLKAKGLSEKTIVVYLSDHGDYFCDYGLMRKGVGTPEVLTRIPMIWSGPGIGARTGHPAFVSTADVMPTLCEAIGAPIPRGAQGRSLWPMLQGQEYPESEFESVYTEVGFGGMYYDASDRINPNWGTIPGVAGAIPSFDELDPVTQCGNVKTIRRGNWKLNRDMMGNGELYNVAKDYYELTNLYDDPGSKQIRDQLIAELLIWTIRTQDDLPVAAYPPKWPVRNWYALYRHS